MPKNQLKSVNNDKRLLFPEPTVDAVWYADKPPRLGGVPRKMSITELEKRFSFKYTETFHVSPQFKVKQDVAKHNTQFFKTIAKLRLKKPMTDKLVLCPISDEVGSGVFARQKITFGTIVAVYSGDLQERDKSIKYDHEYALDIDTKTGDSPYAVDAKKIGGIARFFQHLPKNLEAVAMLNAQASRDPKAMQRLKLLDGQRLTLDQAKTQTRITVPETKASMLNELRKHTGQYAKSLCFEYDSITFTPESTKKQVAWANIELRTCMVDGHPVVFFQAIREIQAGEQIGFSYGNGYWFLKERAPLLFSTKGHLLDARVYKRNKILIHCESITPEGKDLSFPYTVDRYLKTDIKTQFPIVVYPTTKPHSSFDIRMKLVNTGALPKSFGVIEVPPLAKKMQNLLSKQVELEAMSYRRDPRTTSTLESASPIDVVFHIKNTHQWPYIWMLLKDASIRLFCKLFQLTQEILILGINQHEAEMQAFLKVLPSKVQQTPPPQMMGLFTQPTSLPTFQQNLNSYSLFQGFQQLGLSIDESDSPEDMLKKVMQKFGK